MNNSTTNKTQIDSNTNITVQIPNYQITQTVYAGSRTLVYRAIRIDDGLPVIIKLIKRQYPTFSELVQFRNQYSIAKNLDNPGIVKPYSLEPYHNGYALVMEDFGGISLPQFIQKNPLTLEDFLLIGLSLIDILHFIHQQRVIHKDIKPANILIHPDTKQVKLIDFSISSLLPKETQQIQSINAPILHQGKLLGILYLENNLATGAFTRDRVELLNLLCIQGAISLENARLYERSLEYSQQLQRSLNELNAAQSRFHNLVDNVPGVVYQYRMNPDGILSLNYISSDCYSLYEITPEQAIANGNFFTEMVHPDDMASYQKASIETIKTLCPWHWEGRIVTPSGILKWVHGESRTEKQPDGSIVWDGLFLDITDRKLIEAERQQKSRELAKALQDLQQAQLQMVQSEKMSALGNLVAGIAHEMNNPLGFIAASLQQIKPTLADIFAHLKLYQQSLPVPSDEIKDHGEEIDLEYSLEDLPQIIDSMTLACDRLKNISTSLRTFSRADKDNKVPFNIHDGINSTILILKHRLKANNTRPAIEILKEYGNLPPVECFPGQLNQVFMNILANGIDALEESNQGLTLAEIKANPNRITIRTELKNERWVKIRIADNGKGMNEEVKHQVFDHLFTTKGVGKGTGLGLAIARSIVVEKHGGTIEVNSIPGTGAEFVIMLPIKSN